MTFEIIMFGDNYIFGMPDTSNLTQPCYTSPFTALKKHREEEK